MVKRLVIIVFILLPLRATTQVLEYDLPEKLPVSINTESEESMPLLSPNGKSLYFSRSLYFGNVGGKYAGPDIWVSERSAKGWMKADNEKIDLNNKNSNAVIGIGSSGDALYLMDASSSKKVKGIYFCKRKNKAWTKPEFIPVTGIESDGFLNFYMSPSFDVLFISMRGKDSKGEEDIYVSIKEATGQWTVPKNLGPTINTPGFEISPFLSNDKKRLYFSSNGHPGMGDADVFVSERLYGSWEAWSVPQNLGNVINSNKFDAYFSVYGDSICFFSSNRNSTDASLYSARISIDDGEKQRQQIESIVSETKTMLEDLRNSTNVLATNSEVTISFNENSSTLSSEFKKVLDAFIVSIMNNQAKKVRVKYDGRVMESSKALQLLTQDRIRQLKQVMKSAGVAESRIVVSSDLFSTESIRIRSNSFQFSIE